MWLGFTVVDVLADSFVDNAQQVFRSDVPALYSGTRRESWFLKSEMLLTFEPQQYSSYTERQVWGLSTVILNAAVCSFVHIGT